MVERPAALTSVIGIYGLPKACKTEVLPLSHTGGILGGILPLSHTPIPHWETFNGGSTTEAGPQLLNGRF